MSTVVLASAAGAAQRGINAAKGDFSSLSFFPPHFQNAVSVASAISWDRLQTSVDAFHRECEWERERDRERERERERER